MKLKDLLPLLKGYDPEMDVVVRASTNVPYGEFDDMSESDQMIEDGEMLDIAAASSLLVEDGKLVIIADKNWDDLLGTED